ncbi:MAG: hypothetical protein QM692_10255 [Thermomicrobiales bacterium]
MDHCHFATITAQAIGRSRRRALTALAVFGAGLLTGEGSSAQKRRRKRKGHGKKIVRQCKCAACATCEKGKCVALPEGSACALGVCREGVCVAE